MIEYFKIEIKPFRFREEEKRELDIKVNVDGVEHRYRRDLCPEDFTSLYDQLFEIAKHALREQITKEASHYDK